MRYAAHACGHVLHAAFDTRRVLWPQEAIARAKARMMEKNYECGLCK